MSSLNMPDRPGLCLIIAAALVARSAPCCAPGQDPQRKQTAIEQLVRADAEKLPAHLQKFITDNLRLGTFYPGQYEVLRRCAASPTPWLRKWMMRPPKRSRGRAFFRTACMRALLDLHPKKPPTDLLPKLLAIATDEEEPSEVRKEAVYTLAGFGDRKPLEELIEIQEKNVAASDPLRKVTGLVGLADIHYRLCEYETAARFLLEALVIYEKGSVVASRGLQTCYYNAACFLAMAGELDAALSHLNRALKAGKAFSRRALETDRDLRPLHADPRFKKLLDDYFAADKAKKRIGIKKK